eukprot:1325003-Amorphochlora_amoeboformis.AAC.1
MVIDMLEIAEIAEDRLIRYYPLQPDTTRSVAMNNPSEWHNPGGIFQVASFERASIKPGLLVCDTTALQRGDCLPYYWLAGPDYRPGPLLLEEKNNAYIVRNS